MAYLPCFLGSRGYFQVADYLPESARYRRLEAPENKSDKTPIDSVLSELGAGQSADERDWSSKPQPGRQVLSSCYIQSRERSTPTGTSRSSRDQGHSNNQAAMGVLNRLSLPDIQVHKWETYIGNKARHLAMLVRLPKIGASHLSATAAESELVFALPQRDKLPALRQFRCTAASLGFPYYQSVRTLPSA